MKHVDMAWEWNWPRKISAWNEMLISFDLDYTKSGRDHTPRLCFFFGLLGWALLDFGYYNIHHEDCDHAD